MIAHAHHQQNDDEYWAALDREWRRRVTHYGRRSVFRPTEDDLDEAYNDVLLQYWQRGHRDAIDDAGGLLCKMMWEVLHEQRRKKHTAGRDVYRERAYVEWYDNATPERHGGDAYACIIEAASTLEHEQRQLLFTVAAAAVTAPGKQQEQEQLRELLGLSRGATQSRLNKLRRALLHALPEPCRGPSGQPLRDRSEPRGRTHVSVLDVVRAQQRRRNYAA